MKTITITGISLTVDTNSDIQLVFYKWETEDGSRWGYETAMLDENSGDDWFPATMTYSNKLFEIIKCAYPDNYDTHYDYIIMKVAHGASREVYVSEGDYERLFS
jgi:hypothetical protein